MRLGRAQGLRALGLRSRGLARLWGCGLRCVLLGSVLCIVASPVRAESPRVYVTAVAGEPGLEVEALRISALARAALVEAQGFVWELADIRARGPHTEARAAQQRALRSFRRGRQAYLKLELEAASAEFERALADWDTARAVLDNPVLVSETLMYLGASYVLSDQAVRAAEVFTRYHVQFAEISPDPRVFNPAVMEAWRGALDALSQRAAGALEVRVRPASAAVVIDGVPRGRGNLRLEGVRPGRHWVRAAGVGSEGRSTEVVVESGRVGLAEFGEVEDSVSLLDLVEHAARPEGARALAQELSIDGLAIIEVRRASAATSSATSSAMSSPTAGSADAAAGELSLKLLAFNGETGREQATLEQAVGGDPVQRARSVRGLVAAWLDRVLLEAQGAGHGPGLESGEQGPMAAPVHAGSASEASSQEPRHARDASRSEQPAAWYKRWGVWTGIAAAAVAVGVTAAVLSTRETAEPAKGSEGSSLTLEF